MHSLWRLVFLVSVGLLSCLCIMLKVNKTHYNFRKSDLSEQTVGWQVSGLKKFKNWAYCRTNWALHHSHDTTVFTSVFANHPSSPFDLLHEAAALLSSGAGNQQRLFSLKWGNPADSESFHLNLHTVNGQLRLSFCERQQSGQQPNLISMNK